MKNKWIVFILCCFVFSIVKAQGSDSFLPTTTFGIKAGTQLGTLKTVLNFQKDTNSRNGFFIGSFLDFNRSEKISILTEVVYSNTKFKVDDRMALLHIPILFKYKLTDFLSVYAGPESQFLLSISKTDIRSDIYKKFILAGDTGIQLQVSPQLKIDARYSLAISRLIDYGYNDYDKFNSLQLGVVYSFDTNNY